MKYVIISKNSGRSYRIDPDNDEIHRSLAQHIDEHPEGLFTKREFRVDEDQRELFNIYAHKVSE